VTQPPYRLLTFRGSDRAASIARDVERLVFHEAFGDTPELLAREYEQYEATSMFFVVIDHNDEPAGVMRIIVPGPAGLKSLNDLEVVWGRNWSGIIAETPAFPTAGPVWDIATLAVTPEHRGTAAAGVVSLTLVQALTMTLSRNGVAACVTVLDDVVLRAMQWQLVRPFQSLAGIEARAYLGSASSKAVWCRIDEWRDRLVARKPALHDLFFLGTGHEGSVMPSRWDEIAMDMCQLSLASS
jgi:hypothetical protein